MKDKLTRDIARAFPPTNVVFSKGWRRERKKKFNTNISLYVTDGMLNAIDILVESDRFSNRSEFIRHLITNYLDNLASHYRYDKRDLDEAYNRGYNNGMSK